VQLTAETRLRRVESTQGRHSAPNIYNNKKVQGGSNMTGTDLYVNKPHCAAAVRP